MIYSTFCNAIKTQNQVSTNNDASCAKLVQFIKIQPVQKGFEWRNISNCALELQLIHVVCR